MLDREFKRFAALIVLLLQFQRVISNAIGNQEVIRSGKSLEMLKYMNAAANPCENFYEFACGSWPKYHKARGHQQIHGLVEVIEENFDRATKTLLSREDPQQDTKMDSLAKTLYGSCMELPSNWTTYLQQLKVMAQEFGQMPVLVGNEWRDMDFDWAKTVAEIHYAYGVEIIVAASLLRVSRSSIVVGRPPFVLGSRAAYTDDDYEAYRITYISDIAYNLKQYLGVNYNLAIFTAKEIVEFEMALALGLDDEKLALPLDEINAFSSIEQMQSRYEGLFDVRRFLNTAWGSQPNQTYYEEIRYLQNLVGVMETAPKRVVANYVFYKLLEKFFYRNPSSERGQQNECIASVAQYFSDNLESLVYRTYNTNRTAGEINDMWQSIKQTWRERLESSTRLSWMPEHKRKIAVTRLNKLNLEITGLRSPTFGPEFSQLRLDPNDFLANMKTLSRSAAKLNRDRQNPSTPPMNGHSEQKVTIPVTMLQPHYLWSPADPMAYNFAKLGSLLAQELVRDFDAQHSQWSNTSSGEDFKCFANQYENYALPEDEGKHRENIATNGGLRLAYHSYVQWYQDNSRTSQQISMETYPRLRYTSQQLFFIHFAQMWCNDVEPNYKHAGETSIDQYTPAEFRVIGSLANLEEFAQEFSCPAGSAMNPIKKCKIY